MFSAILFPYFQEARLPIYQAIVLAIIQGLAEFIPVSSSGHLILVRRLLGWNELSPAHELTFDVALHFGTLLSVLIYFRRTWFQIVRAALGGKVVRFSESTSSDVNLTPEEQKEERMLLWFLAIATIPGAIAGKLLENSAEDYFREHVMLIAGALIVVALLMWWGEKISTRSKPHHLCRFAAHRLRASFRAASRSVALGLNDHCRLVPKHDSRSCSSLQLSSFHSDHRWRGPSKSSRATQRRPTGRNARAVHCWDSYISDRRLRRHRLADSLLANEYSARVHHLPNHRWCGCDRAGGYVAFAVAEV
jgi:undecaprenyl pyrophosphate phosphatase UppP